MTADEDLILLINFITQHFYAETIDNDNIMEAIQSWRETSF